MSLMYCPDCGRQVSSYAKACIHCGRPFDDLPKKVIRKCGTGETVLEIEHITLQRAQQYIDDIVLLPTYKFSFKNTSGSEYRIIPDIEHVYCVTDLKCVARKCYNGAYYIKEEDRLTPTEAIQCLTQLQIEYAKYQTEFIICDNDAQLNWHVISDYNNHSAQPPAAPQQPRCPTCGSPYIERISATSKAAGAFAFGLFSKTAKSQFRCKNCGYKW